MQSGGLSGHVPSTDYSGAHSSRTPKTPAPDRRSFRIGDVVKAHFVQGQWYLATIQQDNDDGTYVIEWLDGEQSDRKKHSSALRLMRFRDGGYVECDAEQGVSEALLDANRKDGVFHQGPFRPGDVVKAHFRNDQFYLATIERVTGDGTYEVWWFDGDTSERTKRLDELTMMRFDTQLQRYTEDSGPPALQEASTGCPTEVDGSSAEEGQACEEGRQSHAAPGEQAGRLAFSPPARRPAGRDGGEGPDPGCLEQFDAEQGAVVEQEPAPDLLQLEHWVVEGENGTTIHQTHGKNSQVLCALSQGDAIVCGDQFVDLIEVGSQQWLPLLPSAKVYRQGFRVFSECSIGGSYAIALDGEARYLQRRSVGASLPMVLRFSTGFGEPWIVENDRVLVRKGPSVEEDFIGYMRKGDILGIRSRKRGWVELAHDSDVRHLQGVHRVRNTRSTTVKRGAHPRTFAFSATPPSTAAAGDGQLWMMVNHPEFGTLLQPCQEQPAGLSSACALSQERRSLYSDVIGLVHRRIYEDNLQELWEGDVDKLPSIASLERKLFESDITVLHATVGNTFAGGAIFKEILVRAKAGADIFSSNDEGGIEGRTTVVYIDSLAAVPGMHAGSAIWAAIASMDAVCVACHSILLESTVRFWKARGFLCFDASKDEDCKMFKDRLRVSTCGRVICELADLDNALPPSRLPLMVYFRSTHAEDLDISQSYVFLADEEPY